jgi:hypothetical protein
MGVVCNRGMGIVGMWPVTLSPHHEDVCLAAPRYTPALPYFHVSFTIGFHRNSTLPCVAEAAAGIGVA